jgi:cytochrome c peroxidase
VIPRPSTVLAAAALALAATAAHAGSGFDIWRVLPFGYNIHLEESLRFEPVQPGADPARGQARFGLAADGVSQDASGALFDGYSEAAGHEIVSNGRTCFTCHRGPLTGFGLPEPPLSASIPEEDALFTGLEADAAGDPDAMFNLDELGLIKYRPNRFNPTRDRDDPFRQAFAWRKSPKLFNIGLAHGLLTDGRGRVISEAARGAVFGHTQNGDDAFPDLFSVADGDDIGAFLFEQFTDPRLAALRDPTDPMYETLSQHPFATVEMSTGAQYRGMLVFARNCMACHNTPNVFNNLANVEPLGTGDRPPTAPPFAPAVAKLYNIGVAERNVHGLRFTHYDSGTFSPIMLPLIAEDGTVVEREVTFDFGLALTSGRLVDVGRFKVPALRGLADNAPYFHDNSAATIAQAVNHHLSRWYRQSRDGRRHPIYIDAGDRRDLIAFLSIL